MWESAREYFVKGIVLDITPYPKEAYVRALRRPERLEEGMLSERSTTQW